MPHRPHQHYGVRAADLLPIIEGLHGVLAARLTLGLSPELTIEVDPEVRDHEHRKSLLADAAAELARSIYPGIHVRLVSSLGL